MNIHTLLQTHEPIVVGRLDGPTVRCDPTTPRPYLRFAFGMPNGDRHVIYAKAGQLFDEGGRVIPHDQAPAWFWPEAAKCSPQALEAVGLKVPAERRER